MRIGIALGSNLGDRLAHLREARTAVLALDGIAPPVLTSRVYETEPVGTGPDAGAFLNAVLEIESARNPRELLAHLQRIEGELGRPSRHPKNSSRTIDLDILYAGSLAFDEPGLVLPHPRLHERRFVLAPLAEIRPDLVLPGQRLCVAALLAALRDPASVKVYPASLE